MKKRVLWLLNHTTLRKFEVPMLVNMGFEVFIPKIYQYEFGDLSASVTYEYDSTLSIPDQDLKLLNQTDFYREVIPQEVAEIMNRYFDMAIFGAFVPQIKMLVRIFKGILLFQAFGLDKTMTYTKLFSHSETTLFDEIRACEDRFWFGASYENLAEVEDVFFIRQNLYLPIGLRKDTVRRVWRGGDSRILFIGPKIMTNPYYRDIYRQFKRDFGDLPHVIGGAQMVSVTDDPAVLGFVPQEQYEYNMRSLAAMYYHSREPRHLHYHPLEAVAVGMPLVFMAGGMLDNLGGRDLPGRCRTTAQAHRLLGRLSKGDIRLAEKIIEPQGVLMEPFKREYCTQKWKEGLDTIFVAQNTASLRRTGKSPYRIAIVIPQAYTGGVLDFSVRLSLAIQTGAREYQEDVEVVLCHRDEPVYQEKDYFRQAREQGIKVRPYKWVHKKREWFQTLHKLQDDLDSGTLTKGYVIEDGVSNLSDCSYVIFTSDRIPAPYFLKQRYAVVVHDTIQRYVPAMFDKDYEIDRQCANRQAEQVLVTTPQMKESAIQYIGIPEERVRMIPQIFDSVQVGDGFQLSQLKPFFLWGTNSSRHKNHKIALKGLSRYYAEGGTLKCVITGANSALLDPKGKDLSEDDAYLDSKGKMREGADAWLRLRNKALEEDDTHSKPKDKILSKGTTYIEEIREQISENIFLKRNLKFYGELEKDTYLQLLKRAKFTFHPGYADNGNGVCVDAAQLGVPTLTADYPAMRYMDERMDMQFTYFDPHDAESISDGLKYMERQADQIALSLPPSSHFLQFAWRGQSKEVYAQIRAMTRGYLS